MVIICFHKVFEGNFVVIYHPFIRCSERTGLWRNRSGQQLYAGNHCWVFSQDLRLRKAAVLSFRLIKSISISIVAQRSSFSSLAGGLLTDSV